MNISYSQLYNITGWWFQPLWKNISQLGWLFPIYGKWFWVNNNISLTWNKAIWIYLGMIPGILTMIPGFGRSEVVIKFTQIYTLWLFNSSPWYRWSIEIDGLPNWIAWWWFSMANCFRKITRGYINIIPSTNKTLP